MIRKLGQYIDPKVTAGNLLTIAIILISFVIGYTKLGERVEQIAKDLVEHKQQQSIEAQTYVRKDVQDVRNRFVDQKLDRIEQKLDILIERSK